MRFKLLRLCESKSMTAVPQESVRYDLDKAAALLREKGFETEDQGVMLIAMKGSKEYTLYPNGRLMMQPVSGKEEAGSLALDFYALVEASIGR
ncbi:MAG TPA: hypothetical protein VMB46_08025 [Methanomassiliicoccales archaeon]|nr:hypothetical protein [Methanomassiliicoccales archaeon]